MGHEWIFDVLRDLSSYARANGLPAVASKAEEALRVAEVEIHGSQPMVPGRAADHPPGDKAG